MFQMLTVSFQFLDVIEGGNVWSNDQMGLVSLAGIEPALLRKILTLIFSSSKMRLVVVCLNPGQKAESSVTVQQ